MADIITERENLTLMLSDQYSKSIISLDEYEKMIDLVNRTETTRDVMTVKNLVSSYSEISASESKSKEHTTVFSWRSTTIKPLGGNAGKFTCVFGTNQIIIDDLPKGKTTMDVEAVFGLTEIIVPKKIKVVMDVVPVFSGIFIPAETDHGMENEDISELYIKGQAVFGNITVIKNGA